MGLFSTEGAQGASTIGAGRSGATSRARFGPDSPVFWAGGAFLAFLMCPPAFLSYAVTAIIGQVRRVRPSRLWALAGVIIAVSMLGALVVTGVVTGGLVAYVASAGKIVTALSDVTSDPALATVAVGVWLAAWLPMTGFGLGLGAILGAAYSSWMSWRRAPILDVEGYSWHRPVGWLDQRRHRKNRQAIVEGTFTVHEVRNARGKRTQEGTVALGLGEYGYPVVMPTEDLLRPMMILGGPGTGKTAAGTSLSVQHLALGSGLCVIDYKDDEYLPGQLAAAAAAHGRRFHHFQLAPKDGRPYRQPHPSAPTEPALYDPLTRGNATSKTAMLLDSVARDGDAKAYYRAAVDVVQILYQVAALTGYDRAKGGFEIVRDLANLDRLREVADMVGSDGRGYLADHPELSTRVDDLVRNRREMVQQGAVGDVLRTISTYTSGPAAGPYLRPGPEERTINLRRAAEHGDVVLFSLSTQDYGDMSKTIGTLALLDLQNTVAELRSAQAATGVGLAAPFYVQIEEFGSAGSEAVLGLLNKARDVNVRPVLSTQSWSDVVTVDGNGVFARQVLDQCGNFLIFGINDPEAAKVMAGVSGEVIKKRPRESKQYSAGLFGAGLKAANMGRIDTTSETETQVPTSALMGMPRFHCVWITKAPTLRAAHTFDAGPNHWWEQVEVALVPPTVLSEEAADDAPGAAEAAATAAAADGQVVGGPGSLTWTRPVDDEDRWASAWDEVEPSAPAAPLPGGLNFAPAAPLVTGPVPTAEPEPEPERWEDVEEPDWGAEPEPDWGAEPELEPEPARRVPPPPPPPPPPSAPRPVPATVVLAPSGDPLPSRAPRPAVPRAPRRATRPQSRQESPE